MPPLLDSIAHDAVLGKSIIIAEAWDAGGLYQVRSFPAFRRWSEWNGRYRDCLRRFIKVIKGTNKGKSYGLFNKLNIHIKTKKGVIPNGKREDEGVLKRSLERNFS